MSIFSRISRSRQQAKEHNAKLAEQQKKEAQKQPYKHVPTHAALDAIASAPPSWRDADRSRVREENRRRNAKAASSLSQHMGMSTSLNMGMPGVPRVSSSLSHVSFPADVNANPMVRLPRSYSYNGITPLPVMYPPSSHNTSQGSQEVIYSLPDAGGMMHYAVAPSKGKEVRRPSSDVPRASPAYLKHLAGESGSSSGSNSSQDDLDLTPTHDGYAARQHVRPSTAMTEAAHRIRPGRRTSDSSIDRIAMANSARALRDSRPPMSMRPIGPSPTRGSLPVAYATPVAANYQYPGAIASGSSSPSTAASSSPTQEKEEQARADAMDENDEEDNFEDAPEFSQDEEHVVAEPATAIAMPVVPEPSRERGRHQAPVVKRVENPYPSADSRSFSVPTAAFQNAAPAQAPSRATASAMRPAPAPVSAYKDATTTQERYIVNFFPEAEFIPEPETKANKRFSKSGSKIKKNRWSTSRTSYAVAV